MLHHSELNLLSQLAALNLPIDEKLLPGYSLNKMVDALLDKVHTLKRDCAMSSKEWKFSLQLMKANPKLMSLDVLFYTNQPENGLVAYCFSDNSSDSAIIAFRGTTGIGWIDNIKGGFLCDTPQQQKALAFYREVDQKFGFKHYTATGHSKGGNNAQYITIAEGEKISHCVTFNSQGFSAEFIRKYFIKIEANQKKIVAYECAWDIVNILLNSIAGQRIVIGTESKLPQNNHPPNRLLSAGGRIRNQDHRPCFYSDFQKFTINLSLMLSKAKQKFYKTTKK